MESQPFEAENPPSRILLIREVMERGQGRFETRSFVSHAGKSGSIGRLFSTCADRKGKCVRAADERGGKENRIGRGRRDERVIYDRSFDILRI